MEKETNLIILFDYYGELLTDKQKEYFTNYYFNNLSLSEISDNLKVSRNAIHKELKTIAEKLELYEDKLHLYEKELKLEKIIDKIENESLKKKIKELL